MIGINFAPAGSSLLWIADSVVRRAGSGEDGSLVGPALSVLRTQAAGPAFGSMIALAAQPENLAALASLLLVAAVTPMLRTAPWSGDASMAAHELLVPV
ncbi:hypothetical protein JQ628_25565 [Bradyrhizobium lablabi]|uniref:hypothetical protein n=1 Tax=Bradyrhizobium lablabi TaxID=722472 RepID=UPI001BAD5BA5|nr:hypothetical protein [Bradyrhizobium lablabi]MBR1124915.1 hypothetical protein [Bradyrhizobium lablabi]